MDIRQLASRAGMTLLASLVLAMPVAAEEAKSFSLYGAGMIQDLPAEGALTQAMTQLVEQYGVFVGFGTSRAPELRPDLELTRADLWQWLSGVADATMMRAQSLNPVQLDHLPLQRAPLCQGSGWLTPQEAKSLSGVDKSAVWAGALMNLANRYSAAVVPADRKANPATPVTVSQAQACLASFAPDIRLTGAPSAPVRRGPFLIALAKALSAQDQQISDMAEDAEQERDAERRARKYPDSAPGRR